MERNDGYLQAIISRNFQLKIGNSLGKMGRYFKEWVDISRYKKVLREWVDTSRKGKIFQGMGSCFKE